ncbi:unnamed protein product, partial [Didymodactylos carnosus]
MCYEEAMKDKFYSFANYYRSSCIQNINYGQGISSKRQFKRSLNQLKLSIDKEMSFLQNAAQIVFEIDEKNRQLGFANYGNEYDKQVKEKLTIWNIFSATIFNVNGTSIDWKDLTTVKYLCDENKAKKLFKQLQEKKLIKPTRISYKFKEQVELPSIFNNKTTKDKLCSYLKQKLEERKKPGRHLNELSYEMFKNDLIELEIFLPCLPHFIKLIQENGFVQPIATQEEDRLLILKRFVEEELMEKSFPTAKDNLKGTLFECLKEMSNEKLFKGKKTEFFDEIKRLFKLKNQTHLSENELDKFYEFLQGKSLIESIDQYSVIKEKIVRKNKEIKNDYCYANLYDFERYYTDEFQQFDLIFRKNFLRAILIEQEFDTDISCFALRDTVDSTNFELFTTQDEAIDYLWNYLRANSLIKSPSVNIGWIDSDEVKTKLEDIRREIRWFLKDEWKNELEEAVNSVYNIIDQTVGEIKKLPTDKTIASYLEIKTNYFLNQKKHVPEALDEFIELAFDVIFQLQEKKEPPKWYEIAAVIALGVVQVVAGVMAKMFIPVAGQLIGEFLISTGCDDILFGVRCAIAGDFSWEKYWQHKKQSMLTSALTSVVFVGVSFLKNSKKLESVRKAFGYQKLTGAKKLHTAATKLGKTANISKYVGKEIVKTLAQTGLSELASMGIDSMLENISEFYEKQLTQSIRDSINEKWNTIASEMKEIFRLCLGRALVTASGGKGFLQRVFTSYAPSLINLGVNVKEMAQMIHGFLEKLRDDLKNARKSLNTTNKDYTLTEPQTVHFENYQKNKIDLISTCLSDTFNQKLKHGLIAPVLNFAVNKLISKGVESLASADRIEQLTNRFELIHAASNPNDTLTQFADELQIFIAEGKPIDLKDMGINPKDIQPANIDGCTLQQVYDLSIYKVKTYRGKDGNIYVRRTVLKQHYRNVRGDKAAGLHEQKKISEILGCTVTKGEIVDNEQRCVLTQKKGVAVELVIRGNVDEIKHAEIIVN